MGVRSLILSGALAIVLSEGAAAALAGDAIGTAGDDLRILVPAVGLGATLFYERGWEGTAQWLASLVVSQGVTEGLKVVVRERRPNGGCCKSFPSGHVSAAFMGAAFIQERYGWRVAVLPYLGAMFTGYSRLETNKHHFHDVFAGAVIGVASSLAFTRHYAGFQVTPVVADDRVGVSLSRRF